MSETRTRSTPPPIFDAEPATQDRAAALDRVQQQPIPAPRAVAPATAGLGPDTGRGRSRKANREPRTQPMSMRVTITEQARINGFLDDIGLSLPDAFLFLLQRYQDDQPLQR
jgi:hypothetical protein